MLRCTAVYDVTQRESFDALEGVWMKEFDMYSTIDDAIKMVVANKVDLVSGLDPQPWLVLYIFTCIILSARSPCVSGCM